jgi:hypothetical protein
MSLLLIEKVVIAVGAVVFVITGFSYRDGAGKLNNDGIGMLGVATAMVIDLIAFSAFDYGVAIPLAITFFMVKKFREWSKIQLFWKILLPIAVILIIALQIRGYNTGRTNLPVFIFASIYAIGFTGHRIKQGGSKFRAIPVWILCAAIIALDLVNIIQNNW